MNIQDKIKKYEDEGWDYEHEFKLVVEGNTLVQFMALVKDGYYRKIEKARIGPAKQYMSDEDIEALKNSWGGKRERSGRPATGRTKKNIYVTDLEFKKIKKYIEEMRKGKNNV